MTTTARQALRERPWLVYVLCGSAVALTYYAVPANGSWTLVRVLLYCLVSASAVPAVLYGVARYEPNPRLPWLLLAGSQILYALADASFYTAHYLFHITTFPFVADVLYLAHYPVIVAGLALLIDRRTPRRDLPSLLDAAVLAVVGATLSWLYLIQPRVHADSPLLVTLASLAYPVMDLALLAVAMRLILSSGRRPVAFFLLAFNLLAFLAADSVYVFQQLAGTYDAGNFLDAVWLSGNIALGTAGLHPTMTMLGEPSRSRDLNLGPLRIASLAGAALVAPIIMVVQHARGLQGDVPVIAAACAVLFLLTIARLAVVVSEQRRLAVTDSLTGLRTRRYFEAYLPHALNRTRRGYKSVAVFIIDIDHFKSINDRYGHPAGDRVLVEIATRLRQVVRDCDVLARYGGEEFALLSHADQRGVPDMAERLRSAVACNPIPLSTEDWVTVTVSVGAASHDGCHQTPAQLVASADRALYTAKAQGRDRIAFGEQPGSGSAVDHTAALSYLHTIADRVDRFLSTHTHGRAVGRWTRLVCHEMGCDDTVIGNAELAGRFHDVGKIVIPEETLGKPGKLDEDEWELLRQHPDHGFRLIRSVPGLARIAEIVRQHHERYDGTGYPRGLAGTSICIEARAIAVCDAWATMLSDRPYRRPLSIDEAIQELRNGRGSQFDPDVVDTFLDLHERGRIDELTRLPADAGPADAQPVAAQPASSVRAN